MTVYGDEKGRLGSVVAAFALVFYYIKTPNDYPTFTFVAVDPS